MRATRRGKLTQRSLARFTDEHLLLTSTTRAHRQAASCSVCNSTDSQAPLWRQVSYSYNRCLQYLLTCYSLLTPTVGARTHSVTPCVYPRSKRKTTGTVNTKFGITYTLWQDLGMRWVWGQKIKVKVTLPAICFCAQWRFSGSQGACLPDIGLPRTHWPPSRIFAECNWASGMKN